MYVILMVCSGTLYSYRVDGEDSTTQMITYTLTDNTASESEVCDFDGALWDSLLLPGRR